MILTRRRASARLIAFAESRPQKPVFAWPKDISWVDRRSLINTTTNRKVAWVTGGGRGIGVEVARLLAKRGFDVGVSSRTLSEVEAVAAELEGLGISAHAAVADVTDRIGLTAAHDKIVAALGPVDVLVCNAGIAASAPFVRTSPELWDRTLAVNLTGVYNTIKLVLPGMIDAGWGRVINIASVAGKVAGKYMSAYVASKHGVVGLTKGIAVEVAAKGVTVNAVCPGFVDTPMTDQTIANIVATTGRSPAQARQALEALSPQRRLMTSNEVAALVGFLVSDDANGIHGQAINLDGGGTQH